MTKMTKTALFLAMMILLWPPVTLPAAKWVQCGTTNPSHASCGGTVGSTCTFIDAAGNTRTGSVRQCPPCTNNSGDDLGLSGNYCYAQGIAVPLCSGGKVIFDAGSMVGCVFSKFGDAEKTQCNARAILKPTPPLAGRCWVCIEGRLASAIEDQGQWSRFTVGVDQSGATKGDFSCLGPQRSGPYEPASPPTLYVQWTPWLNRDTPGGTGDFETLRDHRRERPREVCERPSDIECRVKGSSDLVDTGVLASGERFTCDRTVGAVCDNRKQPPGARCRDYEVRFACPGTLRQDL